VAIGKKPEEPRLESPLARKMKAKVEAEEAASERAKSPRGLEKSVSPATSAALNTSVRWKGRSVTSAATTAYARRAIAQAQARSRARTGGTGVGGGARLTLSQRAVLAAQQREKGRQTSAAAQDVMEQIRALEKGVMDEDGREV
jgi:hypothetical protein